MKKKLEYLLFGFIQSIYTMTMFYNGIYFIAGSFKADTAWGAILLFVLGGVSMILYAVEAISIGKDQEYSRLYGKEKEQKK